LERELRLINKLERLSEEHRMLQQTLTETIQPQMRGLLAQHRKADQIALAVRNGHVKTPAFMPKVDEGYWDMVRRLVVGAVYSIWSEDRRPTRDRREVVSIVQDRIGELKKLGRWPRGWQMPGRDTVIRRENEAADVRHYPDGVTPIIAVAPGRYSPNPLKFDEPTRSELKKLAEGWGKRREV